MRSRIESRSLLYTERGKQWLEQFKLEDRETAEKIVSSLTLVSHSEFELFIQQALEQEASKRDEICAFYSVREIDDENLSYFDQAKDPTTGEINALLSGSDHGSEARIQAIIRNFCKTDSQKFLNHPTIEKMRDRKCRTIFLVDDFIGSGDRVVEFIRAIWRHKSFTSWHSRKYLKVVVVAYSGTVKGVERVRKHKVKAEIILRITCPTFKEMPWTKDQLKKVMNLCREYGKKTSQSYYWDGWGGVMGALIFAHSCPDNVPAVLWAEKEFGRRWKHQLEEPWKPLFPNRVVNADEKSVFPPEITRHDPITVLLDVGQKKLAMSGALLRRGELGATILVILALIAKGQRRQSSLSFATGLSEVQCAELLEKCVKWEFITPAYRLTPKGRAELQVARKLKKPILDVSQKGEEYYYPSQLRRITRG